MYKGSTLQLKKKRERSVIHRHPWIFSGAVEKKPAAENGEIVKVVSDEGKVLGYGFYSPDSQITCRLFDFSDKDLQFDKEYWAAKLDNAYSLRKKLVINPETDSYRLLHAEGDFFPGIIADVYAGRVVLQLLIKGTELLAATITEILKDMGYIAVYLKSKTSSQVIEDVRQESRWLLGDAEVPVTIKENGISFRVDVEKGQKTGFFLDQRENRQLVKLLSRDKKVLNTFCYSGGFSLYAASGGAKAVYSVDISKDAIAACRENMLLNGFSDENCVVADCFEYLRQADDDFDLMVLDPPAFAKNARNVPNASRGYKDLNFIAFRKIRPGGIILTFSCSQNIDRDLFQKIVFGAAADARRNVRILKHLDQPADHPVNIYHPEGQYLKGLLLQVD